MAGQSHATDAAAEAPGIAISITLPGTPPALYSDLLQLLAKHGYTVQDSSVLAGGW